MDKEHLERWLALEETQWVIQRLKVWFNPQEDWYRLADSLEKVNRVRGHRDVLDKLSNPDQLADEE